MDDLALKLDELLRTNDYAVFCGYRDFLKDLAVDHAATEWKRFQKMLADGSHPPTAEADNVFMLEQLTEMNRDIVYTSSTNQSNVLYQSLVDNDVKWMVN